MKLPDLEELIALRGAAQGLSFHARRPALARLAGMHRSAQRGRGLEFEEVRLYAPGDDARNIDWRVTARRGKTHTKLFREERECPVWLVADLHPGLFFGSKNQYKSALLLRSAAILAWVAAQGGDRLGAVICNGGDQPLLFPPRGREAGVLPVLQALESAQPREPGVSDGTSLSKAISSLLPLLRHGSLVLILSDFFELDDKVVSMLAGVGPHNDFRLLAISDPLEQTGLPNGGFRVGLPNRSWWIDGESSRAAWSAAWAARDKRLIDMGNRFGMPVVRLETAQSAVDSLPGLLREAEWTR